MNCHGNHDDNNNSNRKVKKHKRHLSHILMMALCCGAPIIIILLIPFLIKIGGSSIAKPLIAIAPFICPLMMLFMIQMMLKGKKDKADKNEFQQNENIQLNKNEIKPT